MEIDITAFITGDASPFDFSRSVMEAGMNAGATAWSNAKAEAAERPMLVTEDQLDALRDWAESTGAWDREEVNAWSPEEVNALFIQLVSGDMREAGMDDCDPDEFDWADYYRRASDGQVSANLYRCDIAGHAEFGRVFYSLDA